MRRIAAIVGTLLILSASAPAPAGQVDSYDYFAANRQMIRNGVQAILTCNGLFTSRRTLAQVIAQELAYLADPVAVGGPGAIDIDRDAGTVAIGGGAAGPIMRAVFRDGIGCIILAPDQDFTVTASLPSRRIVAPARDPARIDWPVGDRVRPAAWPADVDRDVLQQAVRWAFERPTQEQHTLSLLVVHRGRLLVERYADGVDRTTKTRTWSTAKSIAATLIGMLVDRGALSLDAPLPIDWLPDVAAADADPRAAITLRDVLQMSSGLEPVDSFGREYATGSGLSYWGGASSVDGARSRGLIRTPGVVWDYENYDTLLAVYAMKQALGDDYATFPYRELFAPLGMHSTWLSTDRFGDFVLSSQVYTNARDLARFGLLYLNGGVWQGERLLSEAWIDFVRTPAPATAARGNFYGGQFWLPPDDRDDVPSDAYATAGNRGQYVVIVPSHELVIVRRGLDYGKQGFNRWDLAREVLRALPPAPSAQK